MSLTVVAQGVETREQAEFLRRNACDELQGFYFNKPVPAEEFGELAVYGSDALSILNLVRESPRNAEPLHPALETIEAEVVWAARSEMARTVEDVLSRRTRCLLFNAAASVEAAPRVAEILADRYEALAARPQLRSPRVVVSNLAGTAMAMSAAVAPDTVRRAIGENAPAHRPRNRRCLHLLPPKTECPRQSTTRPQIAKSHH